MRRGPRRGLDLCEVLRVGQSRSIDILIRSYFRDASLLARCLASIWDHVVDARAVHVVVPRSTFRRVDLTWLRSHPRVQLHSCDDFDDDYVGQQITKLHADLYTDAEVVLLVDSDQQFVSRCFLGATLFDDNGRLRYVIGRLGSRLPEDGWRRCPVCFFRSEFDADLAGPPPIAVPRQVFSGLRHVAQTLHGVSLHDYAIALRGDQLCESALFAGWLMQNASDAVAFEHDTGDALLPSCRTHWSRAPQGPTAS